MAVSNLPILLQLFGAQAPAGGLYPALNVGPAEASVPQSIAPGMPPELPVPPQRPATLGGTGPSAPMQTDPAMSPEAADPSTPKPTGQVLARLKPAGDNGSAMGSGAVKAIELAKGKSKWGAVAAGLAAGLQAQELAAKQQREAQAKQLMQLFQMATVARRLDQGDAGLDIRDQANRNAAAQRAQAAATSERRANQMYELGRERNNIARERMTRQPVRNLLPVEVEQKRQQIVGSINSRIQKAFENGQIKTEAEAEKMRAEQTAAALKRAGIPDAAPPANVPPRPGADAAPAPAAKAGQPTQIKTADDWAKLPSGTQYLDPNGQLRTKR